EIIFATPILNDYRLGLNLKTIDSYATLEMVGTTTVARRRAIELGIDRQKWDIFYGFYEQNVALNSSSVTIRTCNFISGCGNGPAFSHTFPISNDEMPNLKLFPMQIGGVVPAALVKVDNSKTLLSTIRLVVPSQKFDVVLATFKTSKVGKFTKGGAIVQEPISLWGHAVLSLLHNGGVQNWLVNSITGEFVGPFSLPLLKSPFGTSRSSKRSLTPRGPGTGAPTGCSIDRVRTNSFNTGFVGFTTKCNLNVAHPILTNFRTLTGPLSNSYVLTEFALADSGLMFHNFVNMAPPWATQMVGQECW
ncbi:hypothetical protein OAO01_08095, partial [Oligoflexia bacterium]|nr:hypothetical protein [Oligoflexia bacterium]